MGASNFVVCNLALEPTAMSNKYPFQSSEANILANRARMRGIHTDEFRFKHELRESPASHWTDEAFSVNPLNTNPVLSPPGMGSSRKSIWGLDSSDTMTILGVAAAAVIIGFLFSTTDKPKL